MRGKKSDPEFIASFIQESVSAGCESTDEIVARAKKVIQDIDNKIKEVENLKIIRSKVLDVVLTFDRPVKDKSEEAKLLPFFKLEYPNECRLLCDQVKKSPVLVDTSSLKNSKMIFAIKQLIEVEILERKSNYLIRGIRFDEYMKFVVKEAE